MGRQMGLGIIGNPQTRIKRKYRYTFQVQTCNTFVPEWFVKSANRPNLDIEETEINFLNGKTWIPGKGTWQELTVTYIDAVSPGASNATTALYSWIASVYNILDPVNLEMGTAAAEYAGQATLRLYDGCGNTMEQWLLLNIWPKSINFGDLSNDSSEECTIELTMRFTNVTYQTFCGGTIARCPCIPCTG